MERKLIYHEPLARVPPLPRVPPTIHWQYVLWKFLTMHEKHQSQLPICKYDIQSTQCTTVHTPLFGTASWPVQVVWFSWIVQGVWFVYYCLDSWTTWTGYQSLSYIFESCKLCYNFITISICNTNVLLLSLKSRIACSCCGQFFSRRRRPCPKVCAIDTF